MLYNFRPIKQTHLNSINLSYERRFGSKIHQKTNVAITTRPGRKVLGIAAGHLADRIRNQDTIDKGDQHDM